ncbi:NusB antitermination factor [Cyclonatronum proteinivorum]|uniref:Transcription antitermination protein NusB n=1 Tax=Cyclonatronum proteinivorum TaxID=1457365 RepID=A0A345ULR8_9BACT|nr:transcription antitermination factor NusB [Cyclonatronum proteinivorum]AXJ01420.1 NusB antitermination factor [Cyclonatronum proteinivorum]
MTLNRRKARETAMMALYAAELSNDSLEHILETVIHPKMKADEELNEFSTALFLKTIRDREELDAIVGEFVTNWDIKRIATIDRCVLRLAITEMMAFEEIPTKVTINEAIEIVKKYSTAKSGKFINGILDAASKKLGEQGKIVKTGSGLITKTLPRG